MTTGTEKPYDPIAHAAEAAFKRGFDAGVKHQREKSPPLKARELKHQLNSANTAHEAQLGEMKGINGILADALEETLRELNENELDHDTSSAERVDRRWKTCEAARMALALVGRPTS